jgi:hypothetical protein
MELMRKLFHTFNSNFIMLICVCTNEVRQTFILKTKMMHMKCDFLMHSYLGVTLQVTSAAISVKKASLLTVL